MQSVGFLVLCWTILRVFHHSNEKFLSKIWDMLQENVEEESIK